jgi:flagellin-like protein
VQNKLKLKARREWVNMKANRKFVEGEEAVSAVIGVILMVAITVAIAATVYMYVSGMIGTGTSSTPSMSLTADPEGTGCTLTVGTITSADVAWEDVWFTLSNTTAQIDCESIVWSDGSGPMTWPARSSTNYVKGGQAVYLTTGALTDNDEYTFTLVYNETGGTLGSVSWKQ